MAAWTAQGNLKGPAGTPGTNGTNGTNGATGPAGTTDFTQLLNLPLAFFAATPDAMVVGAIGRDANEAVTTFAVAWPDGATGTYTTTTASSAFPGAVDAYTVTHVLAGVTKTATQAALTRDAAGAVTVRPAITVG